MNKALDIRWIYGISAAFIAMLAVGIVFEWFYIAALPLVLGVLWAAFFRTKAVLFAITAFAPVSLNLEELELGGVGFYLPTEPLLLGVTALFFFRVLARETALDAAIYRHPITRIVLVYLTWIFLTSITSELPLVSFKFLVAKLWFIVPFFFMAIALFRRTENAWRFYLLYLAPLMLVIIYTVIRHAGYGFEKDAGHWVMDPFFKDHTSYGAVLAMFVPPLVTMLLRQRTNNLLRFVLGIMFIILMTGVVLSYTRAAWVSLLVAAVVWGMLQLRVKFRTVMVAIGVAGAFVWMAQDDLLILLEKNKQDSSDDLAEHVESISNVSSDASNLERLNRWYCAFALFEERPLVGWGPGTYQFVYAPFQRAKDRTIISTNNADGGNAHSEYFGPLAEQGIPGMLIVLVLVLTVCSRAFRLIYALPRGEVRMLVTGAFLGLMTYYVHGTLNNYLDTDKASIPFWAFTALLVSVEIYHLPKASEKSPTQERRIIHKGTVAPE